MHKGEMHLSTSQGDSEFSTHFSKTRIGRKNASFGQNCPKHIHKKKTSRLEGDMLIFCYQKSSVVDGGGGMSSTGGGPGMSSLSSSINSSLGAGGTA